MTKRNITKAFTVAAKLAALLVAAFNLPELSAALGDGGTVAAIGFTGASALKDVSVVILDYIDDGKRNDSFTIDTLQ